MSFEHNCIEPILCVLAVCTTHLQSLDRHTIIIEPSGYLLKTSSPRLNASRVAIVITPSEIGSLRLHRGRYLIYNATARVSGESSFEVNSRCV